MSVNKIILIGRWTRDPELRYTPNGVAVAQCKIACDRPPKQDGTKETDFIPVVIWQKQAETTAQVTSKGWLVYVEGRLQIRKYTDNNGATRWITEIVAHIVKFLAPPKNGNGNGEYQEPQHIDATQFDYNSITFDESDIPF